MWLVTGASGHLGEALMRLARRQGRPVRGLDLSAGPWTDLVGDIRDPEVADRAMAGVTAVLHTATLHKPHIATHRQIEFVETNIAGTLRLLEAACAHGVPRFIFTSTTSAFGSALSPGPDAPAAWIDESVPPVPRNIYGTTKRAAEELCELFARRDGLGVVVLRTSRFFPEADDNAATRAAFADANAKANEFAYRRVDLEDAAAAHVAAAANAAPGRFSLYVISAPTPFRRTDVHALRSHAPRVLFDRVPGSEGVYARLGYRMFEAVDRVYDSSAAQRELGWRPRHTAGSVIAQLDRGEPPGSDLARAVGIKGYHAQTFSDGPYPVLPG